MDFKFENDVLTVFLTGNIDSNNAESVGEEIDGIRAKNPNGKMVLDMENLKYISSAGLRQILRLKKKEKDLVLINVSSEIYEVFEMTGFTEMMDIEKAYRKLSVDGCEVIGEGSNGVVYRINPDTIIKVYKNADALDDIKRERELARTALVLGVNTAIPYDVVKVGNSYGSVFELLSAKSLTKLINENVGNTEEVDKYIKIFVDMLKDIHNTPVKAGVLPDAKKRYLDYLEYIKDKLPEATYNKLHKMMEEIPDSNMMIHGDYHTNNVHYASGEAILIDMDTLATGDPVFELCNMFLAYHGFGELDHDCVSKFLKIDWDTCQYILEKTFRMYIEGRDNDSFEDTYNKAALVGFIRLYRRTIKRSPDNTELIEHCKNRIIELTDKVDNLVI